MAITYSISGGADAAKFNINATTGALVFKTAPDFENPGDANKDNVFEVTVKATDAGGAATTQDIKVTVTDVSENAPPQITSAAAVSVKENSTTVLTVTATDPDDGGTPPDPVPSGDIPLSYDDPRFASNGALQTGAMANNVTISRKKYESLSSSGSTLSSYGGGNFTLDTVNIHSRECIRVGAPGNATITNCYLEATGQGSDHADAIQAYSPGARGTITIRNSSIVASNNTSTTSGVFISDNWTGTLDVKDTVFRGGPYGVHVYPDTGGDNIIIFENVFFVAPFLYGPMHFEDKGGHRNIFQKWVNVCNATIVNGKLVPGTQISKPY